MNFGKKTLAVIPIDINLIIKDFKMIFQDDYSSNKTIILNHFGTVTIAKNNFAILLKRTISSIMDIHREPIKGFQ